jgi:hypothetical protein
VTAAAAVATAFFYWRGYLAAPETERASRTAKIRPMPIVAPELYKSGAGLGAVIQF